jgi:hypothetical protein
MIGALEQNHDFHAQNDWIEGVDFLRKSTLGSRGFGYTYRGFALAPEGSSLVKMDSISACHVVQIPPEGDTCAPAISSLWG